MNTKQLLISSRAKIADPANWTQKTGARDENGESVFPSESKAVCWCAVGAIGALTEKDPDAYHAAVGALREQIIDMNTKGFGVAQFNDSHTHEEVLALFDRAIAAQREPA